MLDTWDDTSLRGDQRPLVGVVRWRYTAVTTVASHMTEILIWLAVAFVVSVMLLAVIVHLAMREGDKMAREDPYWDM